MNGSRTGGLGGSVGFAVQDLERQLKELPDLTPDTKESLAQGVREVKDQLRAYEKDVWFYRIVVGTLGITILLIIIAITLLIFNEKKGFDALTAIGSAAIGGLVGLLAPSPVGPK
jgi:hypothetical protein